MAEQTAFPSKAVTDDRTKEVSAKYINEIQKSPALFSRIAAGDMNAVRQCLDNYGNAIWALAKKFTGTIKEAEAATQEIFLDIWKHADRFDETKFSEEEFILLVARRYFFKRKINSILVAKGSDIDDKNYS